VFRIRSALERERFDVVHLHEPMTPTPCVATLALCTAPMVATFHASGDLGWMRLARPVWGFLADRLDRRIAVSERARSSAERWLPGDYEIVPNGVLIPPEADPGGRAQRVVFAGRHENRKGLHVLLRAWPEIRARTGATLRVCGADPLRVRLLMRRLRVADDGIDVLGFLPQEQFTAELLAAKALIAPSLGGESFGIVLLEALACEKPIVATRIDGYAALVGSSGCGRLVPPGDSAALAAALDQLLSDDVERRRCGARGLEVARGYDWTVIARRLEAIYEETRDSRSDRVRRGTTRY
jgi:phosphatidylinositol alpha-mannosyltransferase